MKAKVGRQEQHTQLRGWFVALLAVLVSMNVLAGQHGATLGVSVQVLTPHQPALAQALPLPLPGHLIQDDARGRHYYFDGNLHDARDYYLAEMQRRGYTLHSEQQDGSRGQAMRWQREGEITVVHLRAAAGLAPTRISLRAMKD